MCRPNRKPFKSPPLLVFLYHSSMHTYCTVEYLLWIPIYGGHSRKSARPEENQLHDDATGRIFVNIGTIQG